MPTDPLAFMISVTSICEKCCLPITKEKKLRTAFATYRNPIEIPIISKNQFRVLRLLKLQGGEGMVSLGNLQG